MSWYRAPLWDLRPDIIFSWELSLIKFLHGPVENILNQLFYCCVTCTRRKHLPTEVEVTLRLTVSMSWYRAPLWDVRPDIIFSWELSLIKFLHGPMENILNQLFYCCVACTRRKHLPTAAVYGELPSIFCCLRSYFLATAIV
jgi:hypothetical protein